MTAQELIEILQQYPPETKVFMQNDLGIGMPDGHKFEKVSQKPWQYGMYWHFTDKETEYEYAIILD